MGSFLSLRGQSHGFVVILVEVLVLGVRLSSRVRLVTMIH
jgi:hypothetical protein